MTQLLPGYIDSLPLINKMTMPHAVTGAGVPIILWPDQEKLLHLLHTYRFVWVLKRRQALGTTLVGIDTLCQASLQRSPYTGITISIGERESMEALAKAKALWDTLPEAIRLDLPFSKENSSELVFAETKGRMMSLPSSAGSGFTSKRITFDEVFKIPNLEKIMRAGMPTIVQTGGQVVCIGTAEGINYAYKQYMRALRGESGFKAFFIGAFSDPNFTQDSWNTEAKRTTINDAKQEYPRNPQEAFLASGNPRFNMDTLIGYQDNKLLKPIFEGDIIEANGYWRLLRTSNPKVRQYHKRNPRGDYMAVIDVAEGLVDGDFSCIKVLDRATGAQMMEWHGHCEPMELGKIACRIGRIYNNALVIIEANNHGIAAITQMRNENYPFNKIFVGKFLKVKADDEYKDPVKRYGWLTTGRTKPLIIDNLAYMMDKGEIPGLTDEDIFECMSYIRDGKTTNAEFGAFDDRVMTLAIAYYLIWLDSFLVHYPMRRENRFEKCDNCKHNHKEKAYMSKPIGRCKLSDRVTHDDEVCSLWVTGQLIWEPD